MSQAGFQLRPGTVRQGYQRFRTLGHESFDDDLWFNVLQDSWIQINKTIRDNTCTIDYGYMCI